jgi:hypothetical protein
VGRRLLGKGRRRQFQMIPENIALPPHRVRVPWLIEDGI